MGNLAGGWTSERREIEVFEGSILPRGQRRERAGFEKIDRANESALILIRVLAQAARSCPVEGEFIDR